MPSRVENILQDTIEGNRYSGSINSRIEEKLDELNQLIAGEGGQTVVEAVEDWLEDHPEITTSLQDGEVTKDKLNASYLAETIGYNVIDSTTDI